MPETNLQRLSDAAQKSAEVRRTVLTMAHRAKNGHIGSALSTVDILSVLYHSFLRVDPKAPKTEDRDRFILSKGHGCSALYATLAQRGYFPEKDLETFIQNDSYLPGHPSALHVPGVELSTGSLGHGLNVGTGMALCARRDARNFRTVVLISDGECDEGSTWEAILTAAHWKLGSLTCIIDYNKIQSFGTVADIMELEPLADKWRAFRWHVQEVDGHNHEQILDALEQATTFADTPSVIIAHTVKGKGVSFMESTVEWHYWPTSDEQYHTAIAELTL
ncbi:MAG: Transketolase [Candidatus Peribacteria bacterium]|nr:Transketolase [Candidatus Peribacteria bacterium]